MSTNAYKFHPVSDAVIKTGVLGTTGVVVGCMATGGLGLVAAGGYYLGGLIISCLSCIGVETCIRTSEKIQSAQEVVNKVAENAITTIQNTPQFIKVEYRVLKKGRKM